VSTVEQGKSGLGLEAQRDVVKSFTKTPRRRLRE